MPVTSSEPFSIPHVRKNRGAIARTLNLLQSCQRGSVRCGTRHACKLVCTHTHTRAKARASERTHAPACARMLTSASYSPLLLLSLPYFAPSPTGQGSPFATVIKTKYTGPTRTIFQNTGQSPAAQLQDIHSVYFTPPGLSGSKCA